MQANHIVRRRDAIRDPILITQIKEDWAAIQHTIRTRMEKGMDMRISNDYLNPHTVKCLRLSGFIVDFSDHEPLHSFNLQNSRPIPIHRKLYKLLPY